MKTSILILLAICAGCTKPNMVIVRADEVMVPLVITADPTVYRVSEDGQPCDGWYVPNATLLRMREVLNKAKE